jgi:sortase (surface protein transpeptidase)
MSEMKANRVIMSHVDGWLSQLQDTAGYYVDVRPGHVGRTILFGHSSRYGFMNETELTMKNMVDADAIGKRIEIETDKTKKVYEIVSKEKVDETDVESLTEVPEDIELSIFTCDYPDVSQRWIYHAVEVEAEAEEGFFRRIFKGLKASLFSMFEF